MAKSVKLQVITPSKLFYEGDIELVIVKTLTGEEGFMADHAWACKLLDVGMLWIREAGSKELKVAAVSGGFIDVMDDIVIYTDAAEWPGDIDTERALDRKAEMEDWLSKHKGTDATPDDITHAETSLSKQKLRVDVATGGGRRK